MSEILKVAYNTAIPKKSNGGVDMDKTKQKMLELSKRARAVKTDPKLRHAPNEHDLKLFSENTQLMQPLQYESITVESEGK